MSLTHAYDTVPAFPLGQPHDGRPRYGMTPTMASLYHALIASRPHKCAFKIDFRALCAETGKSLHPVHDAVTGLVERGWLTRSSINGAHSTYAFVHPIMRFKEPTRG